MLIFQIPDREFLIRVGYIEIYNEKVSDLLGNEDVNLKLHEDSVSITTKFSLLCAFESTDFGHIVLGLSVCMFVHNL